jgi:glyoxylase-like metal-dependent hydrolase (beta-lactamase superfamily II)
MASVDVLITGYADDGVGMGSVQPTISLVRSDAFALVVDPGLLPRQDALVGALAQRGLTCSDITHVFVTHHHLDHTRNIGLFPYAAVVDYDTVYSGDLWAAHDGDGYALAVDVTVLQTPGHTDDCASLLVQTDDGVVVLTHAWSSAAASAPDVNDDDPGALERSRARIAAVADVIVPAHGAPFRATDY